MVTYLVLRDKSRISQLFLVVFRIQGSLLHPTLGVTVFCYGIIIKLIRVTELQSDRELIWVTVHMTDTIQREKVHISTLQ